ncbi:MAG: aminopeptidase [Aquificae bacterium]|nr:aminopeptidase [Aquificota bacterium]
MLDNALLNLLHTNLRLSPDDELLVFTDDEKPFPRAAAERLAELARQNGYAVRFLVYPSLKGHGKEPPEELWRLTFGDEAVNELKSRGLLKPLLNKEPYDEKTVREVLLEKTKRPPTAVVALAYYSTTHTAFRRFLTDLFKARYASMPLFDEEMVKPLNADWEEVAKLSKAVAEALTEAEYAELYCPHGTRLELSLKDRRAVADTGLLHEPGSFGNLPAGEGFIAPLEEEAQGTLVTFYGPDEKLPEPLRFTFKDGEVVKVEGGGELGRKLVKLFNETPAARKVAELGVGTNPEARRPYNVLEAEKIMGTFHVAVGDNHTFGGKTVAPFHVDFVVFGGDAVLGGRGWRTKLLEKGRLKTP